MKSQAQEQWPNECDYLVTQLALDVGDHDHAQAMLGKKVRRDL
jgi:hypothetical protein